MKKSNSDYFSLKPVRGSSPTSSLAADLSCTMHIDQSSPQLPTPRRSLFNTTSFELVNGQGKSKLMFQDTAARDKHLPLQDVDDLNTPPIQLEGATTPPIQSSSPGFALESMDISPLPHKAPFSLITEVAVASPSPEATPTDEDMLSPCDTEFPSKPELLKPLALSERKKNINLRPSLTRTKGFSTNSVPLRCNGNENQMPTFKFGSGCMSTAHKQPSLPTLAECFAQSPVADRKTFEESLLPPPHRPRQSSLSSRASGSPLTGHVRKQPAPSVPRPRKQFRRSLSMFEHPGDIMDEKKDTYVSPSGHQSMDVDEVHTPTLPSFIPEDQPDGIPRITKDTMVQVLDGQFNHIFDKTMIIDCRFEYEYEGGHITGALNYNDKDLLADALFEASSPCSTLIILHCEYSKHRAPRMAKYVRSRDRQVNDYRYPRLSYPEVYILDGGYSSFFEANRTRCFPQQYVGMEDKRHEDACERGMSKVRQQRAKLSRAQTFAFGDQPNQIEESPIHLNRFTVPTLGSLGMASDISLLMTADSPLDSRRAHTRRMISF
ncbi:MAG: cell division cycle- protein [Bathelium mastoideum]|nr:MAG: cell division cycle- protein [Bathelium mastoideum]